MACAIIGMMSGAGTDDVDARTRRAPVGHGFGLPTVIDVRAMRMELDVAISACRIRVACHPARAHQAIENAEPTGVAGKSRELPAPNVVGP